eukprot:15447746-Alexandrium_andersonii.AAC.1
MAGTPALARSRLSAGQGLCRGLAVRAGRGPRGSAALPRCEEAPGARPHQCRARLCQLAMQALR